MGSELFQTNSYLIPPPPPVNHLSYQQYFIDYTFSY